MTPISGVDVEAVLTELASKHHEKYNWRTSIVDLMNLLGLDSSLAARKELAALHRQHRRFRHDEYLAA